MLHLISLFPILFSFLLVNSGGLELGNDLQKDLKILNNASVYISDNKSLNPSLQTIANDMQLFNVVASIDLSEAAFSSREQGRHQVSTWQFAEGEIKAIHQIKTSIALDTVVTNRYLENRAPTQQRIVNQFTFRTYAVATATYPLKMYYVTEGDQGLLEYRLGDRKVELVYHKKKVGLSDILPAYTAEISHLVSSIGSQ